VFSRLVSVGVAIGLSSVLAVGLAPVSVAEAAHPAWGSATGQTKRPLFRPWTRSQPQPRPSYRWRPQTRTGNAAQIVAPIERNRTSGYPEGRWHRPQPLLAPPSAVRDAAGRTSGPVTTARFRPDKRAPTRRNDAAAVHASANGGLAPGTYFRPPRERKRPRYEDLQSKTRRAAYPVTGYARQMVAAPTYGYRGYWPTW